MYTYKLLDSDNHTIYASDYQKKNIIIKKTTIQQGDESQLLHQVSMMKMIKKRTNIRIPAIYKYDKEEIWMEKFDVALANIQQLCVGEYLVKYIIRYIVNIAYQLKHAQIYVPLSINHILLNIKDPIDLLSHRQLNQQLNIEIGLCGTLNARIVCDNMQIDNKLFADIGTIIQQFTKQVENKSQPLLNLLSWLADVKESDRRISCIYKSAWLNIPIALQLQRQLKWQIGYDNMLQHIIQTHKKQLFETSSIYSNESDNSHQEDTLVIPDYFIQKSAKSSSQISIISSEDFKDIISDGDVSNYYT